MFKVIVNDGTQPLPDDDIYYIVSKEGVFLKKRMGVMESIAPVKNISILNSIDAMARMHINPIPAQWSAKILSFFRAVYEKFRGEAIVLLFYNEETGKYKIVPPHQKVTAGSLNYNRGVTIEGHTMIGTIHSHGSMSAFHSGVDDDDETSFDGLHITYGNVMQAEPSISASIVANGHRFMVDPEAYMLGVKKTKDVDEKKPAYTTKVYKYVDGKMQLDEKASSRGMYVKRTFDKRYAFTAPPSKSNFNAKWMNMVERGTYTYYGAYGVYGAYDGQDWRGGNYWQRGQNWRNRNWGGNYDANAWKQRTSVPQTQLKGQPPALPAPADPPKCDSKNPCLSCKHRDIKIMDEMQGLEYEEEMYLCENCGLIMTTGEDNPQCPKCKTDKHLSLIEEKDLKDMHEKGNPPIRRRVPDEIDKEAALNSAQSMEQPDQQGYETCEQCGNTFLRLATDECCPYCQTLLAEASAEESFVDEMEWQCPYCNGVFAESEVELDNHCPHCNGLVELTQDTAIVIEDDYEEPELVLCPRCRTENSIKGLEEIQSCYSCGFPYDSAEFRKQVQMDADAGAFMDEPDEDDQAVIDAAAEADQKLERIPDPEKDDGVTKPLTAADKIKAAMGRVFGRHGNDTIH